MKIISYKCPNCMAPMKHDIDTQQWVCDFCNTKIDAAHVDLLDAIEGTEQVDFEYVSIPPREFEQEDGAAAYVCPSCGGHIITNQQTAATFCVFCHNPTVVADHLQGRYRPEFILPFKINKEQALKTIQKHCSKKLFLPKKFKDIIKNEEIAGMYVPFWLFNVDLRGSMSAIATLISSWSDSKYNYTKTDTYNVQREGDLIFRFVPADGSSRMDDDLMDSLEPFDYKDMVPFSMQYLSGHFAEVYDVESDQCRPRIDRRVTNIMKNQLRQSVSGYSSVSVTSFKPTTLFITSSNVMLPVWTLSVKFRDKIWVYALNGQNGKTAGKLPISIARVFAWLGVIAAGVAALSFIVFLILHFGGALY